MGFFTITINKSIKKNYFWDKYFEALISFFAFLLYQREEFIRLGANDLIGDLAYEK